jgi:aerobic-type carbon monoxide dehydrogenase small subunit (CoxS/CutS family)
MMAPARTKVASGVGFVLNGVEVRAAIDLATTAFDLLRRDFRLTSVRSACDGIGMCGACTILVNGRASPSCLLLAIDLAGTRVETVDALADGERLHPLQQAFVAQGALQCGYCTAGMLLSAKALLDETPTPTRDQIASALTGNLCRCTGYAKIFDAIESAARGSTT